MPIANTISDVWCRFQEELLPALTEILGPLSDRHRKLVTVLEFATPERFVPPKKRCAGRPREDRAALARSFIAKAVWNMPTTRDLLDRVHADPTLRRLCGWSRRSEMPCESVGRGDVFAGVCGVCRQRIPRQGARGDDPVSDAGQGRRAHLARLDRHRGAGEARAEAEARNEAEARSRASPQGRGG